MSQQLINVGVSVNDGTGTPLRDAMIIVNQNFTELYTNAIISNTFTVGNSTVYTTLYSTINSTANSSMLKMANSSGYANLTPTILTIGNSIVSNTYIYSSNVAAANLQATNAILGNLGNQNYFFSNGTAGFGTSSPLAKVDVRGQIYSNNSVYVNLPHSDTVSAGPYLRLTSGLIQGASSNSLSFWTYNTDWVEHLRITANGNIGIGTSTGSGGLNAKVTIKSYGQSASPIGGLRLQNIYQASGTYTNYTGLDFASGDIASTNVPVAGIYASTYGVDGGSIAFWNAPLAGTLTERVRIDMNGNFGIANSSPTHKLSVNGQSYFSDDLVLNTAAGINANGTLGTTGQSLVSNSTGVYWGVPYTANNATYAFSKSENQVNANSSLRTYGLTLSNPGIGTGDVWLTSGSGINVNRNATSYIVIDTGNYTTTLSAYTGNFGNGFFFAANGNLGIQTTTPTNRLEVVGNTSVSGTVFASHFDNISDVDLKENITTVTNPFDVINTLNPVSFNWKETGEKSFGFIAQEVERVLPEIVHTMGRIKTVSYTQIIAFLVSAVKKQQEEINELKNKG